ncbi:MAG: hypothetical protein ABJE66_27275 [Deltaproteobacteria bacterium]
MWRVCLVFVGACSFAFMPPPSTVATRACNDGFEAPVTDTIIGGAALASSAGIGALQIARQDGAYPIYGYLIELVPLAVLFSSSAVYGYLSRQRCDHMREDARRGDLATRTAR